MEKISIEKIIEIGVQIGVKTALERIKKEKDEKRKSRYDRRLRNTKLLLRNYRNLIIHCTDAVNCIKKISTNAIDILDEFEDLDENLYIESISRSTERTAIIIAHINKMLQIYKGMCEASKKPEDIRKYQVIKRIYLDDEGILAEDLAEELKINQRTVYKDIDDAVRTLSALIFGIDGLNIA